MVPSGLTVTPFASAAAFAPLKASIGLSLPLMPGVPAGSLGRPPARSCAPWRISPPDRTPLALGSHVPAAEKLMTLPCAST
jgi:hypothetical protein